MRADTEDSERSRKASQFPSSIRQGVCSRCGSFCGLIKYGACVLGLLEGSIPPLSFPVPVVHDCYRNLGGEDTFSFKLWSIERLRSCEDLQQQVFLISSETLDGSMLSITGFVAIFPQITVCRGKREKGMDCTLIMSHQDPGTQPGTWLVLSKCYLSGWRTHTWMDAELNYFFRG